MDSWINQLQLTPFETITIEDDDVADAGTGSDSEFWMCSYCVVMVHNESLIKLSKCSHMFCKECLGSLVRSSTEERIPCLISGCDGYLLETEIKSLRINQPLSKNVKLMETAVQMSCYDVSCPGTFSVTDGGAVFNCGTCNLPNCMDCESAGECKHQSSPKRKDNCGSGGATPAKVPKLEADQWEITWNEMCKKYNDATAQNNNVNSYNYEADLDQFLGHTLPDLANIVSEVLLPDTTTHAHDLALPSLPSATVSSHSSYSIPSYTVPTSLVPTGVYKCYKPGCPGLTTYAPGNPFRWCPICRRLNCVNCEAQHGGMRCTTFQSKNQGRISVPPNAPTSTRSIPTAASKGVDLKGFTIPKGLPPFTTTVFKFFLTITGYGRVMWDSQRGVLKFVNTQNGTESTALVEMRPTFPFDVLGFQLRNIPTESNEGIVLRRFILRKKVFQFIGLSLAVFSQTEYQESAVAGLPTELLDPLVVVASAIKQANRGNKKGIAVREVGWAKGTGYGSGRTGGYESAKTLQAREVRRNDAENYVISIFNLLTNFINPREELWRVAVVNNASELVELWPQVNQIVKSSPILDVVFNSLNNDSVLDMAHHIPLFTAILRFVQSLASVPILSPLLTAPYKSDDSGTISDLVTKLKEIGTAYTERLRTGRKETGEAVPSELDEKTDDEKLIDLVASTDRAINRCKGRTGGGRSVPSATVTSATQHSTASPSTANVNSMSSTFGDSRNENPQIATPTNAPPKSREEIYLEEMKKLQFGFYAMVVSNGKNGLQFSVAHAFADQLLTGVGTNAARVKRLAQENVTLSRALPLSFGSSIFIRCDTDRLDVMKVLITGPVGTPYANGCFEFDIFFPLEYPNVPPRVLLKTTGRGSVRFNPNLYNCGKVCLSILNTWDGRPEERWNPKTSSLLPVLVAIQSLVLIEDPYFNEPGHQARRGTAAGDLSSASYNETIRIATIQWGMVDQILNPTPCFKEVIESHFWLKREEILAECESWVPPTPESPTTGRSSFSLIPGVSSAASYVSSVTSYLSGGLLGTGGGWASNLTLTPLQNQVNQLKTALEKIKRPAGIL